MKINAGCGARILEGYVNVDVAAAPPPARPPDILCDLRKIPLADGCAEELMAIHVVEHLFAWEVPDAMTEWYRLLKPGGKMILEMPDILKAARNLAEDVRGKKHPDQLHMWAIYGDERTKNPFMMHKAGWWFARLKPVVMAAGFENVIEQETQFHGVGRAVRDFRLEACKPASA